MSTAKKLDENVASSSNAVGTAAVSGGVGKSDRFPPGVPYIVGNEGAERFSFYGMKAILWVYLASLFGRIAADGGTISSAGQAAADAHATEVVHLFVAGVYAFPLLGAIIADRWLGKYRVIFWVSVLYCVGHAILAVAGRMDELGQLGGAEWGFYIGLAVIAFSSGGIKPCVSANVGDQFTSENGHLVSKVFQIFYFMINFGSFISTLMTPLLYRWFGPEVAFGVPGVLMAVATVLFWMGRKKFVHVPPKPGGVLGFLDACITLLLLTPLLMLAFGGILPATADFVFAADPTSPEVRTAIAAGGDAAARYLTGNPAVDNLLKSGTPLSMGAYFSMLASNFWLHGLFTLAAVVLGLVLFTVRQKKQPDNSFLPVVLYSLRNQKLRKPGQSYFDVAREKFGQEAGDGPPAVLRIIVVFSMVSVFWALFDQHASTWVAQAGQMGLNLTVPATISYWAVGGTILLTMFAGTWIILWVSNVNIPRKITFSVLGIIGALGVVAALNDAFGVAAGLNVVDGVRQRWNSFQLAASQLSALNPVMVMAIIPLLNVAVYAPLRKRGIEIKPLHKMTAGMFLAAVAFGAAAILQKVIESRAAAIAGGATDVTQVHSLWQAAQYFIMTTSEVLVSITGLEFAYTQAPRAMKSTIMGFWLLCVTFGNLIVAFLAPLQKSMDLSQFFWVFAGLMAAAAVVFMIMAAFYRGKTYLQDAPAAH